jgi:(p)ppGpp synthase/HD superfamily hydrolase
MVQRMQIAQTNIQLYNQLLARELPVDELVVVHRAYELLTTLYPAYYQADGKPFVAHGVGVASIVAELGEPAETVAVGLLHNVYGNADFGDGRRRGATPFRRRLVRDAVGAGVEAMLERFQDIRVTRSTIEETRRTLSTRSPADRSLLLVELADYLEKYTDMGVLYYAQNDWVVGTTEQIGDQLVALAGELGQPRLGDELGAAFAAAAAHDPVPAELAPSDGRRYLTLVAPHSLRPRLAPRLHPSGQRARRALRPRTRLRRLRSAVTTLLRL